ncbi:hypothetical protein HPO96_09400 [Kribbella sandramycini]|uniref:Uncharacterized protein n=1 Tax=Kribbella sandramycini TaxID=60450 RepID=A0A7Y4NZY1_9ACTN|nr:hypothetical protein [Kribbella sandramycini]MBB6569711.1 hypothetical protein [Kribbella sandramycini]NOL40459.1 hypothetical protein [Kribbella sandramycini]
MLLRPAIEQAPEQPSIGLGQESGYQDALRAAVVSGGGRPGIEAASAEYAASPEFVAGVLDTPLGGGLEELADSVDALEAAGEVPWSEVASAVEEVFGSPAGDVVGGADYQETVRRLRDSLIAIKVLQQLHGLPIERLTRQLRTAELIADVAAGQPTGDAGRRRRRSLELPVELELKSRLSTRDARTELEAQRQKLLDERRKRVDALLAEHDVLRNAITELAGVESVHFRATELVASDATRAPDVTVLTHAISSAASYTAILREQHIKGVPRREDEERAEALQLSSPYAELAQTLVQAPDVVLPVRAAFTPVALAEVGFVLKAGVTDRLSQKTQTVLKQRGIDLGTTPLDKVTQRLQADLATTVDQLEVVAGHPEKHSFVRFGDALISVKTPLTTGWGALGTGGFLGVPYIPMSGSVPETKGTVAPAGIADLLLVKQQLVGYEAVDVAHIENVLKGELKSREHTRREESETITFVETETSTAEEHELESTDRFEMSREASETIKEDVALKAGLTISGSYGPTVEFAASAEGSFSRSKAEATKSATTFSQDVTERTSRKISERVLQRTTVRTLTETIEKNVHALDNTTGSGHISGVYQWVNKVYRAQMYNYGLRMMFDFMIPEPAAFLVAAMNQARNSALTLTKPPDFTLTPAQLSESNYAYWVKVCGATDVAPPPELFRTKSADFKGGGGDSKTNYNHSAQITIDDGYRAVFGSVGRVWNIWETDASVDVVLGRRTQRMMGSQWLWTTTLDDERDSIPFALDTWHASQVAIAIEVKCQRTDRAMEKWRLETHAKLLAAHKAQVAGYEEKLAQLKLQAGVAIRGRNPVANQVTIRRELQKNCLSILTDQHFDLFDAVVTSAGNGLPQIDVKEAAAEGAYVRFFEQAFEWEHMSWVSYPYFWGSKDQWDERLGYDDPDPAFVDFLQAGYCRTTVPVRPGFEGAVDHFLTFGEIWNGGPLPTISSPLYLPIADELAERLDRPGAEVPQGEPWTVRVPTSLVKLRADDALPVWAQDENGEWVEA